MRLALTGILVLVSTACAPQWQYIESKNERIYFDRVSFIPASQWMLNIPSSKYINIKMKDRLKKVNFNKVNLTHNGFNLESITFFSINSAQAFPLINRKAAANLPLENLAEKYIAEHYREKKIQILRNEPATIARQECFHIILRQTLSDGTEFTTQTYGFVYKGRLYIISYKAPTIYFYKKYQRAFTDLLNSIELS